MRSQRGWAWIPAAIGAAASLLGGDKSRSNANAAADRNIALQREFAQNGIRWKVADAKAAGIHPVYALGASTPSFQPVDYYNGDAGFSQAGQDISRAILQGQSQRERQAELDAAAEQAARRDFIESERLGMDRQRHELELELLRSQIMRNQQAVGPAIPSPVRSGEVFQRVIPPSQRVPGTHSTVQPGMQRYGVGYDTYDLPGSELSESLEGMGVMGHVLAPLLTWQAKRDRAMLERSNQMDNETRKALGPPKPGHYWRYVPRLGWTEEPKYNYRPETPGRPRHFVPNHPGR